MSGTSKLHFKRLKVEIEQVKQVIKSWGETSAQTLLTALSEPSHAPQGELSHDLLEGASAIARFVFGDETAKSRRRVYNLADQKRDDRLPVFRMGTQICARKSTLLKWI